MDLFKARMQAALYYARKRRLARLRKDPPAVAPEFTGTPQIAGSLVAGQTLSIQGLAYSGTEPVEVSYRWLRGTTQVGTDATYQIVVADQGGNITCEITLTNSAGDVSITTAAVTIPVPVVAPSFTGTPAISGTPEVGQVLSLTGLGRAGTEPITVTYDWLRGATQIGSSETHTVTEDDQGFSITCLITLTNSAGTVNRTTAAVSIPAAPEPDPEEP